MIKMFRGSNNKFSENPVTKKQIKVSALKGNWSKVYDFLENFFSSVGVNKKNSLKILLASEEIFANISNYAYPNKIGEVKITIEYSILQEVIRVLFEDRGIPFNPLLIKKPKLNLPPSQRKIGGLGIFMVRRMMNSIDYEYTEGKNRLLITKNLTTN